MQTSIVYLILSYYLTSLKIICFDAQSCARYLLGYFDECQLKYACGFLHTCKLVCGCVRERMEAYV